MSGGMAAGIAVTFLWLGMVAAISFLEAPLKFQAPGVTIPLGLGIGRLVFRALNSVECVWAVTLIVLAATSRQWPATALTGLGVAAAALAVQLIAVRRFLSRRADAVLADPDHVPERRSTAHLWYVGFEIAKTAGLIITGTALLTSL